MLKRRSVLGRRIDVWITSKKGKRRNKKEQKILRSKRKRVRIKDGNETNKWMNESTKRWSKEWLRKKRFKGRERERHVSDESTKEWKIGTRKGREREMDWERKNGQRTNEKKIVIEEDINTNIAIVLEWMNCRGRKRWVHWDRGFKFGHQLCLGFSIHLFRLELSPTYIYYLWLQLNSSLLKSWKLVLT